MKVLRESTKQKTARSAKAFAAKKKTNQRLTKAQLVEHEMKQKLSISSVAIVDSHQNFGDEERATWFSVGTATNHRFDYLYRRISKLITAPSFRGQQIFIWGQLELFPDGRRFFPVLCAAICKFKPTDRASVTSIQSSFEEFVPFMEAGLAWVPLEGLAKVNVLQLTTTGQQHERGYALPLLTRHAVDSENPKVVALVSVHHNGKTIKWCAEDYSLSEFMEYDDDVADLSPEAKAEVKRLLKERKQQLKAEAQAKIVQKQEDFMAMVARIAAENDTTPEAIEASLDAMHLIKFYPTGLPEPEASSFGPCGGVHKLKKINRFADAHQLFVS